MKILGYILAIAGFLALFLNGNPRNWSGGRLPVWARIAIDVAAAAVMVAGMSLANPR